MNKKIYLFIPIVLILALVIIIGLVLKKDNKNQVDTNNIKIVTSFYPINIMLENLTEGAENIELTNLTQQNVGCLHDYTLVTSDMKKMEKADIFIENGLGLESFIEKITSVYPHLKIINSSENIKSKIENEEGINPHIWTSIENYISQIETIKEKLCEYNPENANIYENNCNKYKEKLNDLKLQYNEEMQKLRGKKVVCLDEALTYLIKELNIDYIEVVTNHEESTLSADTVKNIINTMKTENIKTIIIEKEGQVENAETLAKETGAKIIKLDACLNENSNDNSSNQDGSASVYEKRDSYILRMENNLEELKQIENN